MHHSLGGITVCRHPSHVVLDGTDAHGDIRSGLDPSEPEILGSHVRLSVAKRVDPKDLTRYRPVGMIDQREQQRSDRVGSNLGTELGERSLTGSQHRGGRGEYVSPIECHPVAR